MTMIALGAAENISVNPTIEKYAATEDIASADNNNIIANIIVLRVSYVSCIELCRCNNLPSLILADPSVP